MFNTAKAAQANRRAWESFEKKRKKAAKKNKNSDNLKLGFHLNYEEKLYE